MDAGEATTDLLGRTRLRRWGVVVGAVRGGEESVEVDAGDDPIDDSSAFQVGSITKTMTGVLTATAVLCGELSLDTTLGEVLDVTGPAAEITVLELATQRSGLPRLPPNLDASIADRRDPYAGFTSDDLIAALEAVEPGPKAYAYSNFGFMTLGRVLSVATGCDMRTLLQDRIFTPLGMAGAGCPPPDAARVQGYDESGTHTPWWTTQLPGAGGVGATMADLLRYAHAHVDPGSTELGQAIEFSTTIHAEAPNPMGLGWGFLGGGWFHDGGTGGFSSFLGFYRPTRSAVILLANGANLSLSTAGLATLTAMARS